MALFSNTKPKYDLFCFGLACHTNLPHIYFPKDRSKVLALLLDALLRRSDLLIIGYGAVSNSSQKSEIGFVSES